MFFFRNNLDRWDRRLGRGASSRVLAREQHGLAQEARRVVHRRLVGATRSSYGPRWRHHLGQVGRCRCQDQGAQGGWRRGHTLACSDGTAHLQVHHWPWTRQVERVNAANTNELFSSFFLLSSSFIGPSRHHLFLRFFHIYF